MAERIAHIALGILLSCGMAFSQLSPGDLAQPHAEFEGLSNCTSCHDIGKKVTNKKCLHCHKEISWLLGDNRGYHASQDVQGKNCTDCHSDHHGRKFKMIRFDENSFDHRKAGYALEGKHKIIDCRECHVPDNISEVKLRKRKSTFLGLDQLCLSCHEDFHQKTLSSNCASCHNTEAFRPAPRFDHSKTKFVLKGKHRVTKCIQCHEKTTKNGKDFQQFTGLAFTDCKSCHSDPHRNRIPGKCTQCHSEASFAKIIARGRFNHNTTGFVLKGQHKTIGCFTCHKNSGDPLNVFRDKKTSNTKNCAACHDDAHDGKFGNKCADCHNESSFLAVRITGNAVTFNHDVTDFPLEGKHSSVTCSKCHTPPKAYRIDFSQCSNCHDDYHRGEFVNENTSPDCDECHSVNEGFEFTTFSVEKHEKTLFPLQGAHMATPCFTCHRKSKRWEFNLQKYFCIDCHDDIHKGYLDKKFYPENQCSNCHEEGAWSAVSFNHKSIGWPLDGKHAETACRACHFDVSSDGTVVAQNFGTLDTKCESCHENIHGESFAINGVTDCVRCHVTGSWMPEKFDHNTTRFPLDGQHAKLECNACHKSVMVNGNEIINYKIEKFLCKDCHQ